VIVIAQGCATGPVRPFGPTGEDPVIVDFPQYNKTFEFPNGTSHAVIEREMRRWALAKQQKQLMMLQSLASIVGSLNQYNQSASYNSYTPSGSSVIGLTPSQTQQLLTDINGPANASSVLPTVSQIPQTTPQPRVEANANSPVLFVESFSNPTRWWDNSGRSGSVREIAGSDGKFVLSDTQGLYLLLSPHPIDSNKMIWSNGKGSTGIVLKK
jgi:hypothetical protein